MVAKRRKVHSRLGKPSKSRGSRKPSLKPGTVDGHERKKDFLSEPEVDRLIAAARQNRHGERDALLVLLLYRHGLRVSEVIRLKKDDIDLKRGRISVRRLK